MERTPKSKLSRNGRINKDGKTKGNVAISKVCSTPPLTRNSSKCSTPSTTNSRDDDEEFLSYSPGFPTTQQGGRGDMDVIWDWSSPVRENAAVPIPPSKLRETSKKVNEIQRPKRCSESRISSPVTSTKRRPEEVINKPAKGNSLVTVLDQLNAIKQQMNSNIKQKTCTKLNLGPERISDVSTEISSVECDKPIHEDAISNFETNTSEFNVPEYIQHEMESISRNNTFSELFVDDDSFSEIMLKCSQQVEQDYFENKAIDLNKNTIESPKKSNNNNLNKLNLSNKTNKILIDKEQVKATGNSNVNKSNLRMPSCGRSILSHNKGHLQDDSFDDILSTLKDDDFSADKLTSNYSNIKTNKTFVLKFPSEKSTSVFSRHSSMPPSPQVKSAKEPIRNIIGRHNSMPTAQQLTDNRQRSNSEKTGSLESIDSRSCSPFQCTPDEIEKKRQDALKRLEARRIQCDIERKRQEALAKLQRKAQSSKTGHRNVPG